MTSSKSSANKNLERVGGVEFCRFQRIFLVNREVMKFKRRISRPT